VSVAVVWFKRDLRISDHRALHAAMLSGRPILPVFVFEPGLMAEPDQSKRHYAFALDALADLDRRLRQMGLFLHSPVRAVDDVLADIYARFGAFSLFSHEETGNLWTYRRDIAVDRWCRAHGVHWQEFRQNGVIRRMASRDGWAEKWDAFMAEPLCPSADYGRPVRPADFTPDPLPAPEDLPLAGRDCPGRLAGNREAADSMLETFLHSRGQSYRREMSSPITAEHSCSRLAPYLSWGVISTKEVTQRTWARLRALKQGDPSERRKWQGSLVAFSGRLHWRCHFMQKLEDQPDIEHKTLHPVYETLRPRCGTGSDPDTAQNAVMTAWETGNTGYPFLDAAIRYLDHHGWINFRMRAMIMAVASYHLWFDWRDTGHHLARQFLDFEPGIHWPQVQMQSGTTGMNAIRIYNPLKQGYDQDPNGHFIRAWVPELASLPDAFIHEPWKWPDLDQTGYVRRVFDHELAARTARDAVWSVRRGHGFRTVRDKLLTKHASRKGRDALEGPRRGKPAPKDDSQLSLF